jgi:hypothetical protein
MLAMATSISPRHNAAFGAPELRTSYYVPVR